MKRRKFYIFITTLCLAIVIWKTEKIAKSNFMQHVLAYYYFDSNYYITNYPEVKQTNMSPFKHYLSIGWKEGKNPNNWFETKLFQDIYQPPHLKLHKKNPFLFYFKHYIFKDEEKIINHSQLKKAVPLKNPKYEIAAVMIFRDEKPYLKEWIEFHRMMGVEHFYLYNHLSKDNFMAVLKPYIDAGIVTLENITRDPKNAAEFVEIQYTTYQSVCKKVQDDVEWLIVFDSDEFLFPVEKQNLNDILKDYNDFAAVSVNWQIYGSGDVNTLNHGELLTEKLRKSSNDAKKDCFVKTIVKPRYVDFYRDSHAPRLKYGFVQVDENKHFFRGSLLPKPTRNIIRINHYWARTWNYFYDRKLKRAHIEGKREELIQTNKNNSTLEDLSIMRFVPALKERMNEKKCSLVILYPEIK